MGTLFWNVNFIDSQNSKLSIFARLKANIVVNGIL